MSDPNINTGINDSSIHDTEIWSELEYTDEG